MSKEKDGYAENRSKLAEMIMKTPVKTNIQEVRPITTKSIEKEDYIHVNIWIPKTLFMKLKIESACTGETIKQLTIEAYEKHLSAD